MKAAGTYSCVGAQAWLGSRRVFFTAAVLLIATTACQAREGTHTEPSNQTLRVDGVERNYLLYAPPNAGSSTDLRPLVFVLHGGGGSAQQIASHVGDRFMALADRDSFYLVFPNAIGKMWDFGAGKVSESLPHRADDRAFFSALLGELTTQLPIDRRRIFATGISRGGQASYFMACSFPRRIRAIAPVAMPLPRIMEDSCGQSPPVGVAIVNGTEDPLVPYNGGPIVVFGVSRDEVLSTDATVLLWRKRNGCGDQAAIVERIDPVDDGMHVEMTAWRECRGAPLTLYRVVGGGHTWPSTKKNLPESLVGKINRDIDATAEIWAFFSQFK